jgi:nitroimidazol reductase NimA-like FMN-containing flavoprotein (pyridoxamine 5'-phosphate oxidase superfamily)
VNRHPATIAELGTAECIQLLNDQLSGGSGVGVVAFVGDDGPEVIPVSFGLVADTLLICTETHGRLARYADGQPIAFELHDLEPALRAGWSVVVRGVARVHDRATETVKLGADVAPWAPGEHDAVVYLPVTRISGRQISPGSGAASEVRLSPSSRRP